MQPVAATCLCLYPRARNQCRSTYARGTCQSEQLPLCPSNARSASPSPVFAPPLQLIPSRKTLTSSYSRNRQPADSLRPPFTACVQSLRFFLRLVSCFSFIFDPRHPFVHQPSSLFPPSPGVADRSRASRHPSTLASLPRSLARSLLCTPLAIRLDRQASARILAFLTLYNSASSQIYRIWSARSIRLFLPTSRSLSGLLSRLRMLRLTL